MNSSIFQNRIALRVDIDFPEHLDRTLPFMLDQLQRINATATFFLPMGPSSHRGHLTRLSRAAYLQRLWRLGFGAIINKMLLAPKVKHRDPGALLREITGAGHEAGVHGYDHAWWSDRIWEADPTDIDSQITQAYRTASSFDADAPLPWASPNWRTRDHVLHALARRGVPYLSECWGECPFLTQLENGEVLSILHLPVTFPNIESLTLSTASGPEAVIAEVLNAAARGCYSLLNLHDYYEGLLRRDFFGALIDACRERKIELCSLGELTELLNKYAADLPVSRLHRATVPGYFGKASWQQTS